MLKVYSIFRSLDGEANGYQNAGQPTTFIRLCGCNLRCKWCDTAYAQEDGPHQEMSVDEINGKIETRKVTITGGEPLFQGAEVATLIARLIKGCKDVTVETNGSIYLINHGLCYLPRVSTGERGSVRFVMDFKLPSSGVESRMELGNFKLLQPEDVVKFVVADVTDYKEFENILLQCWGFQSCKAKVAISPAISMQPSGPDLRWAAELAEMVSKYSTTYGWPVQYSLQIHKVLWPYANAKNER